MYAPETVKTMRDWSPVFWATAAVVGKASRTATAARSRMRITAPG
jgi:hypothetical protein